MIAESPQICRNSTALQFSITIQQVRMCLSNLKKFNILVEILEISRTSTNLLEVLQILRNSTHL